MATDLVATHPPAAVDPEFNDPALLKLRDLIYRISGIYFADSKFYLLAGRAQRRMRTINSGSYPDYLDRLTTRPDRDAEMRALLNEITIGETYFYRSQPTLDAVAKVILPKLLAAPGKQTLKKIRVWSAGCSTGEESYSLAMLFREQLAGPCQGWNFEIVATDLNENSVAKCREGIYGEYALKNISPILRQKYFTPQQNLFRVNDELRSLVRFDRLNLQDQAKMLFMRGFDLIFCCNVLIYFDGASKRRTVEHFYNALVPGGHFFLGECETLFGIYDQFRLVHFPGVTGYSRPAPGDLIGGPQ